MSTETEVYFGTTDPRWHLVKESATRKAGERIGLMADAVRDGVTYFRDSGRQLVENVIKKPPPHISIGGAIFEAITAALALLVPEEAIAHAAIEVVKTFQEMVKPTAELLEKANEEITANSVEEAKKQLTALLEDFAEQMSGKATEAKAKALDRVPGALDSYVDAHPDQPLQETEEYYGSLCDAIGIRSVATGLVSEQIANKLFFPFRDKVEQVHSHLRFETMGEGNPARDMIRLAALISTAEKEGKDPEALVKYLGADAEYWRPFIATYREKGKKDAMVQMAVHLGIVAKYPVDFEYWAKVSAD